MGAIAAAWMCRRSKVRVTVDGKTGKLLVETSAGVSEIRIADVAKAEFGMRASGKGSAVYRLELVLKNGERVPATASYFSAYSLGDQAKTTAAIDAAVGGRSA